MRRYADYAVYAREHHRDGVGANRPSSRLTLAAYFHFKDFKERTRAQSEQ